MSYTSLGALGTWGNAADQSHPLFCLNTNTYQMERVECDGESPGWIFKHEAVLRSDLNVIEIGGGELLVTNGEDEQFKDNQDSFYLQIDQRIWHRITDNRRWRQYSMRYHIDRRQTVGDLSWYTGRVLEGLGYPVDCFEDDESDELYRTHVLYVGNVAVNCSDRHDEIRLVIKGALTKGERDELLSKIRSAAERTHRHVTEVVRL